MTIGEALGTRLSELMKERNLTAYKLFKLTGVSQTTIADILKVRNKAVNVRILLELCQGLNIELEDFFKSPYLKIENIID